VVIWGSMKGSRFQVRVSRIGVGRTSGHAGFVGVGVADVGTVQYIVSACLYRMRMRSDGRTCLSWAQKVCSTLTPRTPTPSFHRCLRIHQVPEAKMRQFTYNS
jgi:hypothetical protein